MPGIVGIVSPLERLALPAILSQMMEPMRPAGGGDVRVWHGDTVAMAVVGDGAPAMLAERSDVVLALAGHVIPDEHLAERVRMAPGARPPDRAPQCLLDLYLRLGPQALEGLNGAYVAVIWDEPRGRLVMVGDRGGLEPMLYWREGSRMAFASRLRCLAAHPRFPRDVNPVAVMDLLAAEQMLDERTFFAAAQALPPAPRLVFSRGDLHVDSYWQPPAYLSEMHYTGEDEAVDGLADRVLQAVSRSLVSVGESCAIEPAPTQPNPAPGAAHSPSHPALRELLDEVTRGPAMVQPGPAVCLLLTGGLDSRLLAGAAARMAEPDHISALTIGHEGARDVRYGREVARVTGLAHTVLPSNPLYLPELAAECVRRTEGNLNVHAAWILGASAYLTGQRIPAVMTGVGAESVSGRYWLAEQVVATREDALRMLSEAHWGYSRAGALLRAELRDAVQEESRDSIRRTLRDAPSDHLLGWADYFAYRQSRRHVTGRILAEDTRVLEPFFDNDLMDYAYRLHPQLRQGGAVYKKMIIQRFPEVAAVRYTDSGVLLSQEQDPAPAGRRLVEWLQRTRRRVVRRAARTFPFLRLPVMSDNPGHIIYYNTWLRTAARPFAQELIAQSELYGDILDVARVRQLVDDHMAGRTDSFRLVDAVLTFALWRRLVG